MRRQFRLWWLAVTCTGLLVISQTEAQQATTNGKLRLAKIEFSGLQRHTEQEAITASGLKIGQAVDTPTLDTAAQRLFDSGLFRKLSYRYHTLGDQAVVTFQVEEDKAAAAPVVFDNFIWFSDEELLSAVRRQIPSFDGTTTDSATDGIIKALQRLLQERQIAGRVEYMPSSDLSGGNSQHIFSVEGVNLPICSLHFSGTKAVSEGDLIKNSKALFSGDYKRSFVLSFAQANLIPIYRERGHLRANFGAPLANLEPEATSNCKDGISVTLPVDEGPVYSWSKAEWSGNKVLSSPELEAALSMKRGDIANGLKIDKGLASIREAYGRKGYLGAKINPTPVFEDASRSVTYQIGVDEGFQYRMGTLTINGASESTNNRLKSKWKLQAGEVYDNSYLQEFMKTEIKTAIRESGSQLKGVTTEIKPDRQKLTVDVTITLK